MHEKNMHEDLTAKLDRCESTKERWIRTIRAVNVASKFRFQFHHNSAN